MELFWQYPAITEKTFHEQNVSDPLYMSVPWATVLDKRYSLSKLVSTLKIKYGGKNYYTCCQHIRFRELIPYLKVLGVTEIYSPHKVKGQDVVQGIVIRACPLYAVNYEDSTRNSEFSEPPVKRDILYSFIGGHQNGYMSNIRPNIFKLPRCPNTLVINTGSWHFNSIVYSTSQSANGVQVVDTLHHQKTILYNKTLRRSRYSLCPSGSGPNSIRLWESLAAGAIPVILADTLELPQSSLWNEAVVFVKEKDIDHIAEILARVSSSEESLMRENCLEIYKSFRDNYKGEPSRSAMNRYVGAKFKWQGSNYIVLSSDPTSRSFKVQCQMVSTANPIDLKWHIFTQQIRNVW